MPTRKRQDRLSNILETLHITRGASIKDLSERLGVSEMTIRRDLEALELEGKVRLVHTGALLVEGSTSGSPAGLSLIDASSSAAEEKRRPERCSEIVEIICNQGFGVK